MLTARARSSGEKMKILYLSVNKERACSSKDWYLQNQLAKMEKLIFYGPGYPNIPFFGRWDVTKIIRHVYVNDKPDVIVIDHNWTVSRQWKNLEKIEIPKAFIISDPHHEISKKMAYIRKNKIDLTLFVLKDTMKQF